MINYSKLVVDELNSQDVDADILEVPLNIFLKSGDVLYLCFIEKETVDVLVVSETTNDFKEELRIVPKCNINYVSVVYEINLDVGENGKDKMFS